MPNTTPEALAAAEVAIRHELRSSREVDPEALARVALEAAAPILAEAWGTQQQPQVTTGTASVSLRPAGFKGGKGIMERFSETPDAR